MDDHVETSNAVRTGLVLGFRHRWNFLPKLTFDHGDYDNPSGEEVPFLNENFLNFVRHVLICHQNATIDKFVLKMDLNLRYSKTRRPSRRPSVIPEYFSRWKRVTSEVDSWIHFVMRKL
ncbi:F-box/FBD/LRR-repeat protein [Corchorus olitorius]|uniref:F-box/FBD/LRR-repeat protein n=1 Tax=Corchorus olitorius TaxID=93759 RepID=A0A1R3G842_9ROSI|nr:F-box/FBD/LRR-repeat protein [Corchorus olitorius]